MGWGSQLDLLPFACQRTYHTRAVIPLGWSNMGGTPKFPRYQVSMMVYKNLVMGKAVCFRRRLPGISQLTEMGGHAGSRRRAVIGLDLRPGPIQVKYG
jgi:hypothetical protein